MTSLTLLTNGNATGAEAVWPGGVGVFMVAGAFQRGQVKLQFLVPDLLTWIDAGSRTNLDAPGAGRFELPSGVKIRAFVGERTVNGKNPSAVTVVAATLNDIAASGPDRELAVVTYLAKAASAGVAVGDTVTLTQVLNLSGTTPLTEATLWRNQTTAQDLAAAPPAASLTISGQGALTNAELRTSAVPVSVSGGPTATAQAAANASLASLDAKTPAGGALTDAQLRNSAVPVSISGVATANAQATGNTFLSNLDGKLPPKGPNTAANSLPFVPATDANIAKETYSSAPLQNPATPAAGGTGFQGLTAIACNAVQLFNPSSVDIEFQLGGAGGTMVVPAAQGYLIQGITNASQVGIRRRDLTAGSIAICAQAFVP